MVDVLGRQLGFGEAEPSPAGTSAGRPRVDFQTSGSSSSIRLDGWVLAAVSTSRK